jgi:hypothetical protein
MRFYGEREGSPIGESLIVRDQLEELWGRGEEEETPGTPDMERPDIIRPAIEGREKGAG